MTTRDAGRRTPPKRTVEELRAESIDNIKAMSKSHPIAWIDIKQQNSIDGTPEGILDVDSSLCNPHSGWDRGRFYTWLAEEVRPLWELSVPHIPSATICKNSPDGGFIRWLWSQTQKIWTTLEVRATVFDPYVVWTTAISDSKNCFIPVAENPNEATAEDILRVAELTKGVGHSRVRIDRFSEINNKKHYQVTTGTEKLEQPNYDGRESVGVEGVRNARQ